jgi:hypothetical protein
LFAITCSYLEQLRCGRNNYGCFLALKSRIAFSRGITYDLLRIPVMWALDSGDVGRRRSEATLVEFYSIEVAHMSQEKGK